MIPEFINWVKGVINKMIGKSAVTYKIGREVAVSDAMYDAIQLWAQLYGNNAPWLGDGMKSLNLPSAIASEIARIVTIEMAVTIEGGARAEFLQTHINKVVGNIREWIEQGSALGGLVLKPYVDGNTIKVDHIRADEFYPISFDKDGELTAAVFVDWRQVGSFHYTRLEVHELIGTTITVQNRAFRSSSVESLGEEISLGAAPVFDWQTLLPSATITNVEHLLLAYFRFPIANNIDSTSEIGMSCFSRAIDHIKEADQLWSDLLWEFESGRRALYIDELAFKKDEVTGKPILPNKRLYRTIQASGIKEDFFKEWTPDIREQNILNGLDAALRKVEYNCGLAYGTLSNAQNVDKTATELKISRQRTYSTVVDTQRELRDTLERLIWAMDIWATITGLQPGGAVETDFQFDDSVIVDADSQRINDMQLVNQGLMSRLEFRVRNFHETETIAKTKLAEILAEQTASVSLFPAETE
jgi:A118 family predicted phage portal protein